MIAFQAAFERPRSTSNEPKMGNLPAFAPTGYAPAAPMVYVTYLFKKMDRLAIRQPHCISTLLL